MKDNLISNWKAIVTRDKTLTEAARKLFSDLGYKAIDNPLSRIGEWENGRRLVPYKVQNYMRAIVLPEVVAEVHEKVQDRGSRITKAEAKALQRAIEPPA